MAKIREQLEADIDTAAQAVRDCKKFGAQLHQASEQIAKNLFELEAALRALQSQGFISSHQKSLSELQRLENRVRELNMLKNQMELGSFMIQINRSMEIVWENLP